MDSTESNNFEQEGQSSSDAGGQEKRTFQEQGSGPSSAPSTHTAMAILAYLGILIVVPFVTDAKNDPFVKFHLKQGLVIVIGWFALVILGFVPVLNFIVPILWIGLGILDLIGIINAAQGKMKDLPLIGSLAHTFKF